VSTKTTTIKTLIEQVVADTSATLTARNPAVARLAAHGARALRPVLRAMHGPYPPEQHPRDVVEALGLVLHEMARRDPQPLIDLLDHDGAPADPQLSFVVGALAEAPKQLALEPLVRALLRHRDSLVRWCAAGALIKLRSKQAIIPLVAALRDRSPMVKGEIIAAMRRSKFFRTKEATEPLRRIVASKRIKTQWPGLWGDARAVLAELEPV